MCDSKYKRSLLKYKSAGTEHADGVDSHLEKYGLKRPSTIENVPNLACDV